MVRAGDMGKRDISITRVNETLPAIPYGLGLEEIRCPRPQCRGVNCMLPYSRLHKAYFVMNIHERTELSITAYQKTPEPFPQVLPLS
jgi:hypothetical protein